MIRLKIGLLFASIICVAGVLASLNGCGGGVGGGGTPPPPPPPPPAKIKHVVIIFQENRTPDNLFHDPVLIQRGADIASTGKNSQGQTITLTPGPLVTNYDFSHSHVAFLTAWNNGAMDGADLVHSSCTGSPCPPPPNAEYQYVQASDVQPYFTMAETYTFGDRMFQTNQGPSFPAHQYIISGTSAISEKSPLNASGNPFSAGGLAGCIAPPGSEVYLIDTTNPDPKTNQTQKMYPCFEHPTLTDLLDTNQISWKYYTPEAASMGIWTGPNAIQHMCGPDQPPPNGTKCQAAEWTNHVVIPQTTVLNDITTGQLPTISWVIPTGKSSDHALQTDGTGPSWVASIVNAIGTSQYWADTAIIITWDDWGGWYDHQPPPRIFNSYEYGFRVPLIVISPYAKAAYISHVTHDFGSVLKFIETQFSLPTIGPGDGYADSRADDLSDCFNFHQTPLPFTQIAAPFDAAYFLNDKSAPTPPDDD